ncbi:unnamed protein product [Cunninghamella echinulata]
MPFVGTSGFRNAAVTKVLVTVIGSCSTLASLFESHLLSTSKQPVLQSISSQWVFPSIGSTVVGTWLIYKLRVIERRYGSSKFAALVFISIAVSTFFQQIANTAFHGQYSISSPYALIFAILYQYHIIIPQTNQLPFLSMTINDKTYVYAAAIQLFAQRMPTSILSCFCGLLTGMVYNNNIGNIQKWRFPQWIRSFSSTYLIPLLGTTSPLHHFSPATGLSPLSSSSSSSSATQLNNLYSNNHSNPLRQRNVPTEVPPSNENIEALISMFPHCSREVVANALISSQHDLNRAAETLLTTAPPPPEPTS